MKTIYFSISVLFLFLYCGCASVYDVHDYPSRAEFTKALQSSVTDKEAVVTQAQKAPFMVRNITVTDDSVYVPANNRFAPVEKVIPSDSIASFSQAGSLDDTSTSIDAVLKSGEKISLEHVRYLEGKFHGVSYPSAMIPYADIKTVSFRGHLKAAITGSLIGVGLGILANIYVLSNDKPSSGCLRGEESNGAPSPQLLIVGGVLGAGIGWLVGNRIEFRFQ